MTADHKPAAPRRPTSPRTLFTNIARVLEQTPCACQRLKKGRGFLRHSTRALVQAVTAIPGAVVQRFACDACGNHLLAGGSGLVSGADAITEPVDCSPAK